MPCVLFIFYRLFNVIVTTHFVSSVELYGDSWMINWKRCERKRSWFDLGYHPGMCLEGPKTSKNISQDSRCSARDSNRAHPEYKTNALTLEPTCSVPCVLNDIRLLGLPYKRNRYLETNPKWLMNSSIYGLYSWADVICRCTGHTANFCLFARTMQDSRIKRSQLYCRRRVLLLNLTGEACRWSCRAVVHSVTNSVEHNCY
jgi:hypothetical protein